MQRKNCLCNLLINIEQKKRRPERRINELSAFGSVNKLLSYISVQWILKGICKQNDAIFDLSMTIRLKFFKFKFTFDSY